MEFSHMQTHDFWKETERALRAFHSTIVHHQILFLLSSSMKTFELWFE